MIHFVNDNEKGHSKVKGSIIRQGRAFWHFGNDQSLCFEWHLFSKRIAAGVDLGGGDDAIAARLCVWLFSLYFAWNNFEVQRWLDNLTKRKGEKYGNGREIGFHWTSGTLFVHLWNDPMEWSSTQPKWWTFSICPRDLILGRAKHSSRVLSEGVRPLTLPEKTYDVKIQITESAWKRPRWPWPHKIVRTNAEVDGGIPVPGKGTESYNCGDDAIYSQTSPGATFDSALAGLFKSVIYAREHYPR